MYSKRSGTTMTKTHKIELESVILFSLAAGVGVAFALYNGHKPQLPNNISLPVIQSIQNAPTDTPTPPPIPKPQITSQISPDGKKQLTLTTTTNNDLTKTYTFVTTDAGGGNQQQVYTVTYATDTMNIPFNTWSPDDKYVFIIHTTTSGTEALVMKADGKPITETESTYNAATIFNAKNNGNSYQETTGWASETLLIINTTTQTGAKGPSYWLEIPSKAIIQLSTQF